jgi:hypothetical protein
VSLQAVRNVDSWVSLIPWLQCVRTLEFEFVPCNVEEFRDPGEQGGASTERTPCGGNIPPPEGVLGVRLPLDVLTPPITFGPCADRRVEVATLPSLPFTHEIIASRPSHTADIEWSGASVSIVVAWCRGNHPYKPWSPVHEHLYLSKITTRRSGAGPGRNFSGRFLAQRR